MSTLSLLCTDCGNLSNRPLGFVRAKRAFVCDHCRAVVRIEKSRMAQPGWEAGTARNTG